MEDLIVTGIEVGHFFTKEDIGNKTVKLSYTSEGTTYEAEFTVSISTGYTYTLYAGYLTNHKSYFVGQRFSKSDLTVTLEVVDADGYPVYLEGTSQSNKRIANDRFTCDLEEGHIITAEDNGHVLSINYTTLDGDVLSPKWAIAPMVVADGGEVTYTLSQDTSSLTTSFKTEYDEGEEISYANLKLKMTATPTTGSAITYYYSYLDFANNFTFSIDEGTALTPENTAITIASKFDSTIAFDLPITVKSAVVYAHFVDAEGNPLADGVITEDGVTYTGVIPEIAVTSGTVAKYFKGWNTSAEATDIIDLSTITAETTLYPIFGDYEVNSSEQYGRYSYTFNSYNGLYYAAPNSVETYNYFQSSFGFVFLPGGNFNVTSLWGGSATAYSVTTAYQMGIYSGVSSLNDLAIVVGAGITSISSLSPIASKIATLSLPSTLTSIAASSFTGCAAPGSISYNGTMEDWASKVTVAADVFKDAATQVIHCIDGDVTL